MDYDARPEDPNPPPASSGTSGSTGAGQQADGGINALRGMIKSIVDEAIASLRPEQPSGPPRVAEGKMSSLSSDVIGGPPPKVNYCCNVVIVLGFRVTHINGKAGRPACPEAVCSEHRSFSNRTRIISILVILAKPGKGRRPRK